MRDYFTDWKQNTAFNSSVSDHVKLEFGVPQGSVLGPLHFFIFINYLPFFLSDQTVRLFADDTTNDDITLEHY